MAKLITDKGEVREVFPRTGKCFGLRELRGLMGAKEDECLDLESFDLEDGRIALFRVLCEPDLPPNWTAMSLLGEMGAVGYNPGDTIVGDVLICTELEAGDEEDDEGAR